MSDFDQFVDNSKENREDDQNDTGAWVWDVLAILFIAAVIGGVLFFKH